MSLELKDFRGKITGEADCVIEAMNRATGKDKSEIVREVLHAWAESKIEEARILGRLLSSEGMPTSLEGIAGNRRESQGRRGSNREKQGGSAT